MRHRLFALAFACHCQAHNADYEVCCHWLCRFAYWLERVWPLPEMME
jgi:hypothetical protein